MDIETELERLKCLETKLDRLEMKIQHSYNFLKLLGGGFFIGAMFLAGGVSLRYSAGIAIAGGILILFAYRPK